MVWGSADTSGSDPSLGSESFCLLWAQSLHLGSSHVPHTGLSLMIPIVPTSHQSPHPDCLSHFPDVPGTRPFDASFLVA